MTTKNSRIALNGFRVEKEFCSQEDIKHAIELYFNSTIKNFKIIHSKKSDIKIEFDNGTGTTIQNKDGIGNGRGWSVDRRKVEKFGDESLITLLKTLCLKTGIDKPIIPNFISKQIINMCLLGENEEERPRFFTHTKSDKNTCKIISIAICPTDVLMNFLYTSLYNEMIPKRTCVHLSPNIYLQRKGGGKKDIAPDNIQMKFKLDHKLESLFKSLNLGVSSKNITTPNMKLSNLNSTNMNLSNLNSSNMTLSNLTTSTNDNKRKLEIDQQELQTTKPINLIRYVDLFCGLGAFHMAFKSSTNFECVLACDIDDGIREIYKTNYGIVPESDIRKINVDLMPDFELLCAGFPCQPFSIAGNGEGFNDKEKGNLFLEIIRIIDAKNPRMCILENVKNLKTHDSGNTYKYIESQLLQRNYLVTTKIINSSDYGSPQARHRIFIIASKAKPFLFPTPSVNITNPVSTIVDLTCCENGLNPSCYELREKIAKKTDISKPHLLFDVYPILSDKKKEKLNEEKINLQKKGGVPSSLDKGGRQGERVYSIDSVGITICASSGGPGAKTGLYKVGDIIRRLTVKETLGMFGFPSDYNFTGVKNEDALFYLGNSIVVNVPLSFVPVIEKWFTE